MTVGYRHPRGTKAALDTLAAANGLQVGQVYYLTDQQRLAVAHATNAYTPIAKLSEAGGGGGGSVSVDPLELLTDYSVTTPSSPETGVKLFSRTLANRRRPAFVGPSGLDTSVQAFLASNKVALWTANGNGTAASTINFGNSATGTPTARTVANTNRFTMMRRLGYAVGTGSTLGVRHGVTQYNRDAGFEYIVRVGVAALPSSGWHNLFVGMVNLTGPVNGAGGNAAAGFGLRLVSGLSPEGWSVISAELQANPTIVHQTLSQTDFPVNTASVDMYEVRLFCPPGGTAVGWSLTRLTGGSGQVATGEITTDLPASNVLLAPVINGLCQIANSGYAIDVVSQYIESDL